jgi:integrase
MGVYTRRKENGDYYVIINHRGQRTSRKLGKIDKRTADKAAREWRKKLALGLIDFTNGRSTGIPLFGKFFWDFINDIKRILKFNTVNGYKKLGKRHLLPAWKNRRLDSFTKVDVRKLLLEKQNEGLVVNNLRICISAIFQHAVVHEILSQNPARNLGKIFRKSVPKTPVQFLTKEQVVAFLETIKKHKPEYHDFCSTAFRTGLRLGELLALGWDCVDFNTKQITVRRSFSHNHWDTPKSHKVRHVDMSEGLHKTLRQRYQTRDEALTCNNGEELCLVFPKKDGEPLNADTFRLNIFKPLLTKAGLPKMRIHDCRHTYASLLLQAGAPIHFVRDQLGHSSITMTVDLYGHLSPGANRDVLKSLD